MERDVQDVRVAWLLIVLAVALRVALLAGVWMEPARALTPDSTDYLRLAGTLQTQGRFGSAASPEIFRVPGYPVFIAAVTAIVDDVRVVCTLQAALSLGTCLIVWRLATALRGRIGGNIALAVQSLSVVSAVYAVRVLSESLFTLLLTAALALIIWPGRARKSLWQRLCPIAAGLALSAAVYVRAIGLIFLLPCAVYWLARRRYVHTAVMIGVCALLLVPWYARNSLRAGYPHFSSVGAINLYRYNACMVLAAQSGRSFAEEQALIDGELAEFGTPAQAAEYAASKGMQVIRDHPFQYAWLHTKTVSANLLPAGGELLQAFGVDIGGSGTLAVIREQGIIAGVRHYFQGKWVWLAVLIPAVTVLAAIYVGAAWGSVRAMVNPRSTALAVLLLISAAYFLIAPGGAAHPRFRVPVMPMLALLAAYAADRSPRQPEASLDQCADGNTDRGKTEEGQ